MSSASRRWSGVMAAVVIVGGLAMPSSALDVTVAEILENPSRYRGESVAINGKIINTKRLATKRGDRYYTFDLSDGARTIAVVVSGEPACEANRVVTVYGRVEATQHPHSVSGIVHGTRVECSDHGP